MSFWSRLTKADKKYIKADAIGQSGLRRSGGRIDEEWHKLLKGTKYLDTYREMSDMDPTTGGVLALIRYYFKQARFYFEPADPKNPTAVEWAEFCDSCISDMAQGFSVLQSTSLTAMPYGWALHEVCYKQRQGDNQKKPLLSSAYSDGKIGWSQIALRAQHSIEEWVFDPDGTLTGVKQTGTKQVIPIDKCFLFRNEPDNCNPQGRSLLRNAFRPWYRLKHVEDYEGIAVETDATGMVVVTVPPPLLDSTSDDYDSTLIDEIETRAQQIRRGERGALVFPGTEFMGEKTGYDVRLMNSGGSRQIDMDTLVKRLRSEIATAIFFAGFLYRGEASHGSFALRASETDTFSIALDGLLNDWCDQFQSQCVKPLLEFNGAPRELWPRIAHGDVETPPLTEISGFVSQLAGAGVIMPSPELEGRLLEMANLPTPEGREKI